MDNNLESSLQLHFGFNRFRPGQAEAIQGLLNGEHALVVMPTGSGKSLIFQLAALHLPGLTLVISPLIALMKDQVDSLERRGIPAAFINSSMSSSEQNQRLRNLVDGKYRLVYIAPERLRSLQFLEVLKLQKISLLAVDEAHCISEWGHDFRPDYLHIASFRKQAGSPLTAALTATATQRVQEDIAHSLGLGTFQRIVTGFNRPNLAFEVQGVDNLSNRLRALEKLLLSMEDGAAIVYTGTRRETEEAAEFIRSGMGLEAQYYHAGMLPDERARIQDAFMAGDLSIVVATNAFGMGIDRPDVRLVVHYSLPGSLEAYYQEAGRAGRDGLPARVVLLYSPKDRALQEWFVENSTIAIEDLHLIFDRLSPALEKPASFTIEALSLQTGLPEGKIRLGLAELERAGAIVHLGSDGMALRMKRQGWKAQDVQGVAGRLKQHQAYRRAQLERMIAYAESNACRRSIILKHFGDLGPAEAEVCCDNCQARQAAPAPASAAGELTEAERTALVILDTVHRLKIGVGREKLAQILFGSRAKDILQFGYDRHIYYARLAGFSMIEIKLLVDQLREMGYLKVIGGEYPVLHLTLQGEAAIQNKSRITIHLPDQFNSQSQVRSGVVQNQIACAIIKCVQSIPGRLPRSGVAKLLVGSESERIMGYHASPFFKQLIGHSRTEVMKYVDQLLNDGILAEDANRHLIPVYPDVQLNRKLSSEDVTIQHIVSLGESRSAKAVPELVSYLQDVDGNKRRLAASALGKIADQRAVGPLSELLTREEKPQVRQYAVKALGLIRDPCARSLLETIEADKNEKEYVRKSAQVALGRLTQPGSIKYPATNVIQNRPPGSDGDVVDAFLSRAHPRPLPGPWDAGWSLGFHSQFSGADWERSEIGELAYRLKYQGDLSVLPALVDQAVDCMAEHPDLQRVDAVTPTPPSIARADDPVSSFARALAQRLGLSYLPVLVKSKQTAPQKEMHTLAQKRANVVGAFALQSSIQGKRLLVVDDLFDSGATLEEIHRLLRRAGAARVYMLTITRTIHSDA